MPHDCDEWMDRHIRKMCGCAEPDRTPSPRPTFPLSLTCVPFDAVCAADLSSSAKRRTDGLLTPEEASKPIDRS